METTSPASAAPDLPPFGEVSTEREIEVLGDSAYQELFFDGAPFNREALTEDVFLIVGRRGAGKTALSRYFAFQKDLRRASAIDVDEPVIYQNIEATVASMIGHQASVVVPQLARLWEQMLWQLIFRECREDDPRIADACWLSGEGKNASNFIVRLLRRVLDMFNQDAAGVTDEFALFVEPKVADEARKAVLARTSKRPIIVAIDTLEDYSVRSEKVVWSIAALTQCAERFNARYARQGIHIKLFLMGETFAFMMEEGVSNYSKYVRNPLHLHWRPRDLLRLLSWRFADHLSRHGQLPRTSRVTDWSDFAEVYDKMWVPFFGAKVDTLNRHEERSFPYVLRHTQLRPRQLVIACNRIARLARHAGTFPYFREEQIRTGLKDAENDLATEVFNAFKEVYPHAGQIADALLDLPPRFAGNMLDKTAPKTAAAWPEKEYSALRFAQVVAEMGIVGKVRGKAEANAAHVEADFEYFLKQRLTLLPQHECVIHPMFYSRLNVATSSADPRVYPFPDSTEFSDVRP